MLLHHHHWASADYFVMAERWIHAGLLLCCQISWRLSGLRELIVLRRRDMAGVDYSCIIALTCQFASRNDVVSECVHSWWNLLVIHDVRLFIWALYFRWRQFGIWWLVLFVWSAESLVELFSVLQWLDVGGIAGGAVYHWVLVRFWNVSAVYVSEFCVQTVVLLEKAVSDFLALFFLVQRELWPFCLVFVDSTWQRILGLETLLLEILPRISNIRQHGNYNILFADLTSINNLSSRLISGQLLTLLDHINPVQLHIIKHISLCN